jgi:nicotinate dehydrogenase subunit B
MSRREFLKTSGALVVAFSWNGAASAAPGASASWPAVIAPDALDSWIAIGADGVVSASLGKVETGMGISTAFMQIVAEELDLPVERIVLTMGDTAHTVDQRGTGSSNGIMVGGSALRKAAAQARATLLALAAEKLRAPVDQLRVKDGIVSVAGDASRQASYAELVGGHALDVKIAEKVKTKDPRDYTVVGQPVARIDIPPKVRGEYRYVQDVRVDGMLHGRVIRPPQAHAKLVSVDMDAKLPGLVKVVRRGDFLGVVCEREEQAIAAAKKLAVKWSIPQPSFSASYDALYDELRSAVPRVSKSEDKGGDAATVLAGAARIVQARYEYPFQSHASMAPACAVADVRDGAATVWFGGQKPYALRLGLAELLKLPVENVRVAWRPGPGSYGQNDADDCAGDCALLSQAVSRPVRLQYSRLDGTGWDPKAPPIAFQVRAGLDAQGKVAALDMEARGYSGRTRPSGSETAGDLLAGQLMGLAAKSVDLHQIAEEGYAFGAKRKVSHLIDWRPALGTGLRTSHLRDPDGMAKYFALESFVDELAFATATDPVEFRLAYLADAREAAVVKAAAKEAGWEPRVGPRDNGKARVATGRGIAYANRNGTLVAIVAEVEVERDTGRYRVRRFTCAHDCGFVVNPLSLRGTIEANIIQAMSRARHEAVRFDSTRVLSVDWLTYPIVDMTEVPDEIRIVLLENVPARPSRGAGEPATRPMAAAIANALFDATGVRLRRCPLTPESLRNALAKA